MRCPQCGLDKAPEEFPRHRGTKTGRHNYCKPCHNERTKRYKLQKHGGERSYLLRHRYGVTEEQVNRLLAAQNGVCAICKTAEPKHVDHSHRTQKVRGLLCLNCNQGMGASRTTCRPCGGQSNIFGPMIPDDSALADLLRMPVNGPGSSFSEVLRARSPELLPPGEADGPFHVPEGTTVLALRFGDGVIVAGDRRATEGFQIAHRSIEKVFAADDMSAVAIAGAAGPAVEMVRLFQTELEHYEKVEGERLTLEGKANKLSQMIRANLPAAMQGLAVVPLFAGFDEGRQEGRIFKYDITGGRYEEDDYHATGSGGKDARSSLKKRFRADLSRDEAVKVAIEALFDAADEDVGTGGPDLMRGIYPTVAAITSAGLVEIAEPEIQRLFEELISERRDQMLLPETHTVDVRRPAQES